MAVEWSAEEERLTYSWCAQLCGLHFVEADTRCSIRLHFFLMSSIISPKMDLPDVNARRNLGFRTSPVQFSLSDVPVIPTKSTRFLTTTASRLDDLSTGRVCESIQL